MAERDARSLLDLVRPLLAEGPAAGARESTTASRVAPGRLREALARTFAAVPAPAGTTASVDAGAHAAAENVVQHALAALRADSGGASPSNLTDEQRSSLEAIVYVTGRPALRYRNGHVQMPDDDLGENGRWRVLVATQRSRIDRGSASVGRVALLTSAGTEPLGTAWRAGQDLVVTNRHVACRLVADAAAAAATWHVDAAKPAVVEFGITDDSQAARRVAVKELVYCADMESSDIAILRLETGGALPEALRIDWSLDTLGRERPDGFEGRSIYIVGHPYRDLPSSASIGVFGRADGSKRCAPGRITQLANAGPRVEHDCSTLGGNSGSCMFAADTHVVVGLHVGGRGVNEETGRGEANVGLAMARLAPGAFADLVRA